MKTIVSLLILVSQFANVLVGGSEDEMLCSRAWRLKDQSEYWKMVQVFFDEYCWPLSNWKGQYGSHCEACYWEEKKRLEKRIGDYK